MDADKVSNLDLDLIIRSGQLYHDIPGRLCPLPEWPRGHIPKSQISAPGHQLLAGMAWSKLTVLFQDTFWLERKEKTRRSS